MRERDAAVGGRTRTLGAPVGASGYGMPSKFESSVQRRQSPGLTPQPQSSVSFTPLQIAAAIRRRIPGFEMDCVPDFRQAIAASAAPCAP